MCHFSIFSTVLNFPIRGGFGRKEETVSVPVCHILQVQFRRSEEGREGREGREGEGNGWRQGSSGKEKLDTRDEQRERGCHSGK